MEYFLQGFFFSAGWPNEECMREHHLFVKPEIFGNKVGEVSELRLLFSILHIDFPRLEPEN